MCGAALLYLEPGICFTRCLAPATFSPAVANKEPTQNTKQLLADAISGIKERWLHPFISPTSWENIYCLNLRTVQGHSIKIHLYLM